MAKKQKKAKQESSTKQNSNPIQSGASNRPVSPFLRLTLLFGLYMAILHVILYIVEPTIAPPMQKTITRIVAYLLTGIGVVNSAYPDTFRIILTHDTWDIEVGCTAIGAMILFCAFVLAYTSTARAKLLGVLYGIPFIAVMNIVRLLALGWITEYFPHAARQFHDFIWETAFLFIVVGMWFIWIEKMVKHEKKTAVSC